MADIIFIGGFGSQTHNIAETVSALTSFYDQTIDAYTFRQALTTDDLHDRLRGRLVITHSAGMLLLPGSQPASVLAIAPPRRMSFVGLAGRFLKKDAKLLRSRRLSPKRRRMIDSFYGWSMIEHLRHPRQNLLMAHKIGRFDAYETGQHLAAGGSEVDLVFFADDYLFQPPRNNPIERLTVISGIPGQHDELLLEPYLVLQEIKQAQSVHRPAGNHRHSPAAKPAAVHPI